MSRWKYRGCDEKDSYTYLVTVPGGDSLLCKPYRKEQFYQLGYSSSTSSSCSSLQAVYCKETINTLSAIVYEESDSCTCHIPACFTCPRHDRMPQLFSTISCTQCNTCSCICDQSKKPKLNRDICRLAELVDVSSSVSDLLFKLRESKAQSEKRIVKKCEDKRRHKCECRPMQNICLKAILTKSSCGECSVKEIKSPVSSSNEEAPIYSPCKRELKFETSTCNEKTNVCPENIEKDVNINLFVNVKKEKECAPVRHRKKCKCKEKKKKETKNKKCKCDISPTIVICDRKPERNKTFLQTIKAMIPNPSKSNKEQLTRCACRKETEKNKVYSVTMCTDEGNHTRHRKLSSITEHPSKPHDNEKSHHNRRSKHMENLSNTGEYKNKHKNDSVHSKDHRQSKPETDIKATHIHPIQNTNITKPEMVVKASQRTRERSGELNTIYLNHSGSSTDRSILMEPEEKTVYYMFLQTYERFPFRIGYNGPQRVTYNVKLSYKSILFLGSSDLNDALVFKKPSTHTAKTEWKPLETPSSLTEMNTNDKFSQVTGIVEQYQDNNDKNFLSIVKKFEEYKNQQRVLEDVKRKMSNSYHKGSVDNFVMRRVIRGKRRVFFTKVKCDYLCRIFCDYIGPLIYFFYLVVFFWVTF